MYEVTIPYLLEFFFANLPLLQAALLKLDPKNVGKNIKSEHFGLLSNLSERIIEITIIDCKSLLKRANLSLLFS
jgi:hypothetical protein